MPAGAKLTFGLLHQGWTRRAQRPICACGRRHHAVVSSVRVRVAPPRGGRRSAGVGGAPALRLLAGGRRNRRRQSQTIRRNRMAPRPDRGRGRCPRPLGRLAHPALLPPPQCAPADRSPRATCLVTQHTQIHRHSPSQRPGRSSRTTARGFSPLAQLQTPRLRSQQDVSHRKLRASFTCHCVTRAL